MKKTYSEAYNQRSLPIWINVKMKSGYCYSKSATLSGIGINMLL